VFFLNHVTAKSSQCFDALQFGRHIRQTASSAAHDFGRSGRDQWWESTRFGKKRVFAKLSSVRHATAPTDPKHGRIVQRQMKDQPVTASAAIQQSSPA